MSRVGHSRKPAKSAQDLGKSRKVRGRRGSALSIMATYTAAVSADLSRRWYSAISCSQTRPWHFRRGGSFLPMASGRTRAERTPCCSRRLGLQENIPARWPDHHAALRPSATTRTQPTTSHLVKIAINLPTHLLITQQPPPPPARPPSSHPRSPPPWPAPPTYSPAPYAS